MRISVGDVACATFGNGYVHVVCGVPCAFSIKYLWTEEFKGSMAVYLCFGPIVHVAECSHSTVCTCIPESEETL